MMNPFSLLIKPAGADCNLRCDYCFYLPKGGLYRDAGAHRMSSQVLDTLVRGYLQTPQPQYTFVWQGGEPTLMGLEFFKQVTALQKQYGRPGSVVANGLQTNATLLTDAFVEHLAEYRFLLGVSLDGPEQIHDRYRHRITGQGSFADVWRGIRRLRRTGVEFNILTLVSQSNVGQAKAVYRYLTDEGLLYHQYIPCVEFDPAGPLMPFAVGGEQWGRFLCELFDCWVRSDTRRVSIRQFDAILSYLIDGRKTICHMEKDCRQYFVVEHTGDIYPCDFFVEEGLRLGNIADTTWEAALASETYRTFGARKRTWNQACDSCEFQALCAGDCQKHRSFAGSTPDKRSILCDGWKMFFRHALPDFQRIAREIAQERMQAAGHPVEGQREAGRNDPCPCGSGLKFKKCCLREG